MNESSCSKSFIKIKLDGGDEKVSVTKLYLQVTIKYLYDEIIQPPMLGGLAEFIDNYRSIIISDSNLRELFPPQVKLMSKQRRYWCGCENFIL